jgi:perosamine synthetase
VTESDSYIPWAKPHFWGNEQSYVNDALASTWISGGPFVDRLETEFAAYCGVKHALTSSNGTTALQMAYLGLDLKPGDEVIVPGFGFLAAANVAVNMSLHPVFCEVDEKTWCMRVEHIEAVLTNRTRAIVLVHTYGGVCALAPILELARAKGISVIEDAAEAFPSRYRGRLAGTFGDIGTYSFQATKTITTGEGGMIVTANSALRERMALFRSHGLLRKRHYWHELPGLNFRLTNLQAALGCAQLACLNRIVAEKARVVAIYRKALSGAPGISLQEFERETEPVVWALALRLDQSHYPQGRDAVMGQLGRFAIETRPGFYTPAQIGLYGKQATPICDSIAKSTISLPSYPTLRETDIARVCEALRGLAVAPAKKLM